MTPKEQAKSVLEAMNRVDNSTNGVYTMTPYQIKENALTAVSALIAEHTFNYPITWNIQRKKYWEQVKEEILKYHE